MFSCVCTARSPLIIFAFLKERIWASGGNKHLLDVLAESGEPILPSMGLNPVAKGASKPSNGTSVYDLRQLHKEKKDLREAHFAQWQETAQLTGTGRPVDAILCPVAPFAAPPHGNNKLNKSRIVFLIKKRSSSCQIFILYNGAKLFGLHHFGFSSHDG